MPIVMGCFFLNIEFQYASYKIKTIFILLCTLQNKIDLFALIFLAQKPLVEALF